MKPIAKKYTLLLFVLLLCFKAFAQSDDDESLDPAMAFKMIIGGVVLLAVGALLSQIKFIEGLGTFVKGVGYFIGGFGVLGIALIILSYALSAALTLALYVGAAIIVGYILYKIYLFLFGSNSE